MLKITKDNLIGLSVVFFVLFASLLGTAPVESEGVYLKSYALPAIVHTVAYIFYFFLIFLFAFLGFVKLRTNWKLYTPMLLLIFSYFILIFWSLVTSSDQVRYLAIFLSVLLCPIGLLYTLERIDLNFLAKIIVFVLSFLVFLSAIYSYLNLSTNFRVSGIHNNPNLMGMWLISLLAVVLYFQQSINKNIIFLFVIVVTALVIFSGSRLSFGVLIILLIPFLLKFKLLSIIIFLFFILYLFLGGGDLDFRSVNMSSAVSDSGRIFIWNRAFECINTEPLIGHGMYGAGDCVKNENVHNSYLRLAVMLGIPLTIFFFFFFLSFLFKVFIAPVNPFIKFYFLGLPLAFFAEDYIVGFASSFFAFFIFMLALFLFDLKRSKIRLKEL